MNVLSLFDGMSCGQIALERAGIPVNLYMASEIDKYAIQIAKKNYPDTFHMGDVQRVDINGMPKIDLILAGSPCQGFSFAGKQLAFDDPRSKLFFEFIRILKECRERNPHVKFLLENVRMKQEYKDVITDYVGVEPIQINSALVSAQNRQREYWSNLAIEQPKDLGIVLADIIEGGIVDRDKSYCLDANYFKGGNLKQYFDKHRRQLVFSKYGLCCVAEADIKGNDQIRRAYHPQGKSPTLTAICGGNQEPKILCLNPRKNDGKQTYQQDRVYHPQGKFPAILASLGGRFNIAIDDLSYRKLTPIECERLQTVPDGYTEGVSASQRYKMLGNGWTVDVIVHILKGLKET